MWLMLIIQATLLNMDRPAVKCQLLYVSFSCLFQQNIYLMNSEYETNILGYYPICRPKILREISLSLSLSPRYQTPDTIPFFQNGKLENNTLISGCCGIQKQNTTFVSHFL